MMRRILLVFVAGVITVSCSPQNEPLSPLFEGSWVVDRSGPCTAGQGISLGRARITGPLGVTLFTIKKATINGPTAHLILNAEGFLDTLAQWAEPGMAMLSRTKLADLDISITLNASATQISPSGVVLRHRATGNFAGDDYTRRRVTDALRLKRCTPSNGPAESVKPTLRRS